MDVETRFLGIVKNYVLQNGKQDIVRIVPATSPFRGRVGRTSRRDKSLGVWRLNGIGATLDDRNLTALRKLMHKEVFLVSIFVYP